MNGIKFILNKEKPVCKFQLKNFADFEIIRFSVILSKINFKLIIKLKIIR